MKSNIIKIWKKLFTGDDCSKLCSSKRIYCKYNLDIEIVHIDPSSRAGRDIQMQYRVMGVPTLITFDGETEVERQVGVIDFSKVR